MPTQKNIRQKLQSTSRPFSYAGNPANQNLYDWEKLKQILSTPQATPEPEKDATLAEKINRMLTNPEDYLADTVADTPTEPAMDLTGMLPSAYGESTPAPLPAPEAAPKEQNFYNLADEISTKLMEAKTPTGTPAAPAGIPAAPIPFDAKDRANLTAPAATVNKVRGLPFVTTTQGEVQSAKKTFDTSQKEEPISKLGPAIIQKAKASGVGLPDYLKGVSRLQQMRDTKNQEAVAEYLKQLDVNERRDMFQKVMQGLSKIAAGAVGMKMKAPVGKDFQPMEVYSKEAADTRAGREMDIRKESVKQQFNDAAERIKILRDQVEKELISEADAVIETSKILSNIRMPSEETTGEKAGSGVEVIPTTEKKQQAEYKDVPIAGQFSTEEFVKQRAGILSAIQGTRLAKYKPEGSDSLARAQDMANTMAAIAAEKGVSGLDSSALSRFYLMAEKEFEGKTVPQEDINKRFYQIIQESLNIPTSDPDKLQQWTTKFYGTGEPTLLPQPTANVRRYDAAGNFLGTVNTLLADQVSQGTKGIPKVGKGETPQEKSNKDQENVKAFQALSPQDKEDRILKFSKLSREARLAMKSDSPLLFEKYLAAEKEMLRKKEQTLEKNKLERKVGQ